MEVVWRDVKGYEGLYEVGNNGRVRSTAKKHLLKERTNKKGYPYVQLSKNSQLKSFYTHKLVALAFPEICGERFEGATVNHKNEVKTDNRPENLEWISRIDNVRYGTGIQRRAKVQAKQKEKKTLVYRYPSMEFVGEFPSRKEASEATGVGITTISAIIGGRKYFKQSGGYVFKNKV